MMSEIAVMADENFTVTQLKAGFLSQSAPIRQQSNSKEKIIKSWF